MPSRRRLKSRLRQIENVSRERKVRMATIAINGLGRIGRAALKIITDTPGLELVAVNDIVPIENIVYLLKYDTVYGRYDKTVEGDGKNLIIGGKSRSEE